LSNIRKVVVGLLVLILSITVISLVAAGCGNMGTSGYHPVVLKAKPKLGEPYRQVMNKYYAPGVGPVKENMVKGGSERLELLEIRKEQ
jgi:hypothetical protein